MIVQVTKTDEGLLVTSEAMSFPLSLEDSEWMDTLPDMSCPPRKMELIEECYARMEEILESNSYKFEYTPATELPYRKVTVAVVGEEYVVDTGKRSIRVKKEEDLDDFSQGFWEKDIDEYALFLAFLEAGTSVNEFYYDPSAWRHRAEMTLG
jgi:hypothetical protein